MQCNMMHICMHTWVCMLQESPLEMELESMTGKPVHTLAVDGNQTSNDSTVLGARLTKEQLEQLADIFADRQALNVTLVAEGPVHLCLKRVGAASKSSKLLSSTCCCLIRLCIPSRWGKALCWVPDGCACGCSLVSGAQAVLMSRALGPAASSAGVHPIFWAAYCFVFLA